MPEDRRHIAVMFTDIVGYTALMGSDEDKAFDMLKRNHNIHATLIEKYNGILIKEVGDGTLASFSLASDAVRCAMDIQQEAKSQNIPLKIGIHEGEMVMAGEDVLGDGVNVASRLQEISDDGSITISGRVYEDVKNKAGIKTKFIGDKRLKNVDDPIKVYKVLWEEEKEKPIEGEEVKSKIKTLYYIIAGIVVVLVAVIVWQFLPLNGTKSPLPLDTSDKTIAVIPFWNDSPAPDDTYLCGGMEEEIRIQLAKIGNLKIESRQSVEKFRENPDVDATTIGKELEVDYIVEGSVQKLEDDISVRVQLIDARSGDHIWADVYDGDYTTKLLVFQRNTARQIASALNAVITPEEEEKIEKIPTKNMAAYDLYLKGSEMGQKYWHRYDKKYLTLANDLYDRALELDSNFLYPIVGKGVLLMQEGKYDSALIYADRAIYLDSESGGGYSLRADCYNSMDKFDLAIENYLKAISLSSEDEWSWPHQAIVNIYWEVDEPIKALQFAIKELDKAKTSPGIYGAIGETFLYIGDYQLAEKYQRMALEMDKGCDGIWYYIWTLFVQGKYADAKDYIDSICGIRPCLEVCNGLKFHISVHQKEFNQAQNYYNKYIEYGAIPKMYDSIMLAIMYKESDREQEAIIIAKRIINKAEDLINRRPGMQNPYVFLSFAFIILNEEDKSLEYLTKYLKVVDRQWDYHDYIEICPFFENLYDNPELKALVKQARDENAAIRAQIQEMVDRGEIDL